MKAPTFTEDALFFSRAECLTISCKAQEEETVTGGTVAPCQAQLGQL